MIIFTQAPHCMNTHPIDNYHICGKSSGNVMSMYRRYWQHVHAVFNDRFGKKADFHRFSAIDSPHRIHFFLSLYPPPPPRISPRSSLLLRCTVSFSIFPSCDINCFVSCRFAPRCLLHCCNQCDCRALNLSIALSDYMRKESTKWQIKSINRRKYFECMCCSSVDLLPLQTKRISHSLRIITHFRLLNGSESAAKKKSQNEPKLKLKYTFSHTHTHKQMCRIKAVCSYLSVTSVN